MQGGYPINLDVSSPPQVARWRPLINWLLVIPHEIWLYILHIGALIVVILSWFTILFTGRLPENWAAFLAGVQRYNWRVGAYLLAWTEQYPSFSVPSGYADPGDFPAMMTFEPDGERNRVTVLLRGILVIPQLFVLYFVGIAAGVVMLLAWFAVLFTGRWPEGMRNFAIGYFRWANRAQGYYFLLTDTYPPFSLAP